MEEKGSSLRPKGTKGSGYQNILLKHDWLLIFMVILDIGFGGRLTGL